MKKIVLYFLLLLLLFGCSKTDEKDWTILIYMAADNGLNDNAVNDIEEMLQAEFSEDINIIVQIDYSEDNSPTEAYRYEIFPGEKQQIGYLGEIDSGDGNELTRFANWGFSKFPADKNALFIWGHGNGWFSNDITNLCSDNESGGFINISNGEFREAMENIDQHLDILVIDACNMQTLEVATEIFQEANYIIAAEDGINEQGFPYNKIFTDWEDFTNSEMLAIQIAESFHYFYWFQELYPISCSVLKTSEFPAILEKISYFTENWSFNDIDEVFTESRENCLEFNEAFGFNLAMDVDVKEFFMNVRNSYCTDLNLNVFCDEIAAVIDSCYIFQKTADYGTGYLSEYVGTALIWFPDFDTQGFYDERKDEYENLNFAETGWLGFLSSAFQKKLIIHNRKIHFDLKY